MDVVMDSLSLVVLKTTGSPRKVLFFWLVLSGMMDRSRVVPGSTFIRCTRVSEASSRMDVVTLVELADILNIPCMVEVAGMSIGLVLNIAISCAVDIPTPAMNVFRLGEVFSCLEILLGIGAYRKEVSGDMKEKEFLVVPPKVGSGWRFSLEGILKLRAIGESTPGVKEEDDCLYTVGDCVWVGEDGVDGGATYLDGAVNGT